MSTDNPGEDTAASLAGGGEERVIRWYTRARKFPQLLGKTPSGSRIPGGPYTVAQVVVGMVVVLGGDATMRWWGRWGLLGNWAGLLAIAYGSLRLVGLLPFDSRSPLNVAGGVLAAVTSPRRGELAGRPFRQPRPQRVRGGCVIARPVDAEQTPSMPVASRAGTPASRRGGAVAARSVPRSVLTPPPASAPAPLSALSGSARQDLTGVQRVLAGLAATPVSAESTDMYGVNEDA